jgi:hypothetical protein
MFRLDHGKVPKRASYITMPSDHISALFVYYDPRKISGAI